MVPALLVRLPARHVYRRLLTTAALSFSRRAYSVVEPPDYPINVIDKQQSIRALAALLDEGKQDEASRTLAHILAARPADGDLDAFRQLKGIIATDNPNVALLLQLGLASASRGYTHFARSEILPIITQFGTLEQFSQVELELENAQVAHRPTLGDKEVFEHPDDDYATMQARATTLQPSVLDLVEQKLAPILPEPSAEDTSIFEDPATEDLYQSTDSFAHSEHLSTGFLDKLLAEGNYDRAYQFLVEMRDLGMVVPPAPKYGDIAWDILEHNERLSPEQTEQFLAWLSLLPPSDQFMHRRMIPMVGRLVDAPIPNIDLIKAVSFILASKGFVLQTGQMLNLIARNLKRKHLELFVEEFEEAYQVFWAPRAATHNPDEHTATIEYIRNNILRTVAAHGRHSEVKNYLPYDGAFKLWPSTYAFLLYYPRSKDAKARMGTLLESLEGQDQDSILQMRELKQEPAIDFGIDLLGGMRYLKNALSSRDKIPHPLTIVHFMHAYLSSGRASGLRIIFDRAYSTRYSRAVQRTFILAEMLFYRRMKHYDLVIETFVNHFYLIGVSREHVLERYNQILAKRVNYDRQAGQGLEPPITRFYKFDEREFLGRKLWPMTLHCNAVWDALVATGRSHDVEVLYAQFLRLAHERDRLQQQRYQRYQRLSPSLSPSSSPSPSSSAQTKSDPPTTITTAAAFKAPQVQPSSFTPFMRPMMLARGPAAGLRILKDIMDLRLKPHLYIYTELAGFYARNGEVGKALEIAGRLESRRKFYHHLPSPSGPGSGSGFGSGTARADPIRIRSPPPDLAFYIAVLRGFLISRNVEAAEDIVQRIRKLRTYTKGENYQYDAALADLRALKKLGGSWTRISDTKRIRSREVEADDLDT